MQRLTKQQRETGFIQEWGNVILAIKIAQLNGESANDAWDDWAIIDRHACQLLTERDYSRLFDAASRYAESRFEGYQINAGIAA